MPHVILNEKHTYCIRSSKRSFAASLLRPSTALGDLDDDRRQADRMKVHLVYGAVWGGGDLVQKHQDGEVLPSPYPLAEARTQRSSAISEYHSSMNLSPRLLA